MGKSGTRPDCEHGPRRLLSHRGEGVYGAVAIAVIELIGVEWNPSSTRGGSYFPSMTLNVRRP